MKPIPCCVFQGTEAADSLLERARCYALLGQRKTAIFDFSAILKEHPEHVQALCGRGFTYLTLNQQTVFLSAFDQDKCIFTKIGCCGSVF